MIEQDSSLNGVEVNEEVVADVPGNERVQPWDVTNGNSQVRENGVYCCLYGYLVGTDIGEEITCNLG